MILQEVAQVDQSTARHGQRKLAHEVTGDQEIDLLALRLWQCLPSVMIQDHRHEAWRLCNCLASVGRRLPTHVSRRVAQ